MTVQFEGERWHEGRGVGPSAEEIAEKRIAAAKRGKAVRLDLSGLGLEELPPTIGNVKSLRDLDLSENRLRTFPPSITKLSELRTIILNDNLLREVPSSIALLTKLRRLEIGANHLGRLPDSISELKALRVLLLGGNQLREIPTSIGNLAGLRILALNKNNLRELPASLLQLKLTSLLLRANPGLGLPPEVIARNDASSAILDYYFRVRRSDRRELREVKILFLGSGAVGKTSLINRLRDEPFDRNERTTHGIRIHPWKLPLTPVVKGKAIGDVTARVWDFGGQEIMHATHQFFLSRRSVYVVVLSGRADGIDQEAEYWLRIVASFAGDSPVIVVRNKIDFDYFELDEAALRADHPQIVDFGATDCETDTGIVDLRAKIARAVSAAPGVRAQFPENWFQIKEALTNQGKSWMTFPDFRTLCAAHGETDALGQERLAGWLHDLGVALNYREDQRLSDTTVLDPGWVTAGIYALLTSNRLAHAGGILRPTDVPKLLHDGGANVADYPPHLQHFLIVLMRKFELCYALPGEDSGDLVPELLPAKQPAAVAKFPRDRVIGLRYRYYVFPAGLIPRFITRMHLFLEKGGYWRRGAILRLEGARALVVGHDFDRTVTIRVLGPHNPRYRLLAMIRSDFATMHDRLKGVKPVEETAVDDAPGLWVSVNELKTFERGQKKQIVRAHEGREVKVTIAPQLDALAPKEARRREEAPPPDGSKIDHPGRDRQGPLTVFVSYSHADERIRKKDMAAVLKVLENERLVTVWDDRMLVAGDDWDSEIREKIRTADLVLFLVSREFLISDYIRSVEAKTALKRAEDGEARIAAIILKRCTWKAEPWARYQVIPTDSRGLKPVQDWTPQAHAWQEVEDQLRAAARKILDRRRR